ncbi:MAG: cupredoxin domain-containing protein [Nitrososphaeraceae archaeon]
MKKIDTKAILPLMISTTFLISLLCYGSQTGFGGQLASATNTKVVDGATDTIQLSAKEVKDGVYNWISGSNGASNPTIKAIVNSTNVIKIQNPTDTKHELIIDTGADVLPSSDDIAPNGSGQLTFDPTAIGTFTYHCAYHPFTMKGTIQIDRVK